jgi:ABC-2 type transport system permease protein
MNRTLAAVSLFGRVMLARAYPRVIGIRRHPSWLLIETFLAVLSVSTFALVYRAMDAPEAYVGFVILGGIMTAFWLNVLWSMGAQLYYDRDAGNLQLFIMAPGSLMAVLAGMALGGMALTMVRAGIILGAGVLLFHVSFAPTSWWLLAGVFLLTLVALYGLGMVFASAFLLWGREAWHVLNLLQEPVYLLSGLNFPVKVLGKAVPYLATLLPMTVGIDALRQVLFPDAAGRGVFSVGVEIALLAVMALAFLALARYCLATLEHRARAEGRLTLRCQ